MLTFVRALRRSFRLWKVRITGGEPLLRPAIVRLVRMLADEDIPDLAMTTNGQMLAEFAAHLKEAGLRRVNVSLDSLKPSTYRTLTGGSLRRTLEGIDAAVQHGLTPLKLNVVLLRERNACEAAGLVSYALSRGCQARFLEVMPIGAAAGEFGRSFISAREVRELVARRFELEPLPRREGSTSRDFRATDRRGRTGIVGFISPCSEPFCEGCRRLRLTSSGRLIGCLRGPAGPTVRTLLSAPGENAATLCELASQEMHKKAGAQAFAAGRSMVSVGG